LNGSFCLSGVYIACIDPLRVAPIRNENDTAENGKAPGEVDRRGLLGIKKTRGFQ
jgi:hypothetical protein